jgi:hypothetical protein
MMPEEAEELSADAIYTLADLLVWQHQVPDAKLALRPAMASHPNPLLLDNLVIASTFSTGQICAVDQETGEQRWHLPFPYYGHSPYAADGHLFGGTSQALLSIDPANGNIRWEFQPYQEGKERLYSSPVYAQGRVFIGDFRGMLHCLSADSGKPLWTVQTSNARNSGVNATALLYEDLVITATNARMAVAYDQATGREVWRQCLPDSSIKEVLCYGGLALIETRQGIYGLTPRTGEMVHTWEWQDYEIEAMTVAEETLCVVITNDLFGPKGEKAKSADTQKTELLGLRQDAVQWRLSYPRYAGARLRYDPLSYLVYEATLHGLGIVDPQRGTRRAVIHQFGEGEYGSSVHHAGIPSIEIDTLYILSGCGLLAKLAHPGIKEGWYMKA